MAKLNRKGNIKARCPDCDGRESTFEYAERRLVFGAFDEPIPSHPATKYIQYRLFRCAGCGRGGLAKIESHNSHGSYPHNEDKLIWFEVESGEKLKLPDSTPPEIKAEFEEAENCLEAKCFRAAAAMFRSTLEKVLEINGYKIGELKKKKLYDRIEKASEEGLILEAQKNRAHKEIRVLGNDVLHEPWREFVEDDVAESHKYTQRIIEAFYDDRATVEKILVDNNRIDIETKKPINELSNNNMEGNNLLKDNSKVDINKQ